MPSKLLENESSTFECSLTGEFPYFYGYSDAYFEYEFFSSNEDVVFFEYSTLKTFSNITCKPKITSNNSGKSTITVKAYARNRKYSESYYIGEAKAEIEVVDNLDPLNISLSSRELLLDMGQEKMITAMLTPEDARTEIIWSSSDELVATVKNGLVKAIGRGNAAIEARTSNGLSAKCYVTVLGDQDYSGVCVDRLYYDLDRKKHTASVVHENPDSPNGSYISEAVIVPEKIQYYGVDYAVTKIDANAFFNCEITSVKLPETIKVVGYRAFSQTQLEEIELPQGLIEIGKEAFMSTNFESIIIGPNVSKLGEGAFANCHKLKAVYVKEDNPYYVIYDHCLYNASKTKLYYVPIGVTAVQFPAGLETIGADAFYFNKAISSVKFPETLINIEDDAFYGCENLERLSFPNSLMEIGSNAFRDCDNLEEINFGSKLKMIGLDAFSTIHTDILKIVRISVLNPPAADDPFSAYDAILVVPLGRVSAYKKDSVWGRFTTITDDEFSAIEVLHGDIPDKHYNVYDVKGVLLRQGASEEEIGNLPAGIYVIGDKKVIVR